MRKARTRSMQTRTTRTRECHQLWSKVDNEYEQGKNKEHADKNNKCHQLWSKVDNEDEQGENEEHADENNPRPRSGDAGTDPSQRDTGVSADCERFSTMSLFFALTWSIMVEPIDIKIAGGRLPIPIAAWLRAAGHDGSALTQTSSEINNDNDDDIILLDVYIFLIIQTPSESCFSMIKFKINWIFITTCLSFLPCGRDTYNKRSQFGQDC